MNNCETCKHAMISVPDIGEIHRKPYAEDCFLVKEGPSELQVDQYLRLTDEGKGHDCEWYKYAGRDNGHE